MSKENESKSLGVYVVLLTIVLLVAVFFVGRLSSQVEMMSGGEVKVADQQEDEGTADFAISDLLVLADELALNGEDFNTCLGEGKFEQRVMDDLDYGSEVGVSGTPSFFVNNIMVVGSQPADIFEAVIEYELAGGDWKKPTEAVGYLLDGDSANGEVSISDGVKTGVGHTKGGEGAEVKIVEFSDFECPYCASVQPIVTQLFEKYGDKISLEYRHFPLSFHANAQKMSEASECAGEQGKFWEMHDLIFGLQG